MRPATPSACSRWRTKVVLPAPSWPCSSRTHFAVPGAAPDARRRRRSRPRRSRRCGGFLESADAAASFLGRAAAVAAAAGLGARAWILPDRRGRGRSARRGSRAAALAGRGFPRRDALHGTPWHEARAPGRTGAGHGERDQRAAWTTCPAAPRQAGRRWSGSGCGDPSQASGVAICPGPRLSQGAALSPAVAGRRAGARDRPFWPPRVHRFRAGAGSGAGHAQRHRLARQAHAGACPRGRLDVLPGRDLRGPRAADHSGSRARTAAAATPASTSVRRWPSSRPTGWTHGAASPT